MQARATEFDLQSTGLEPALVVVDLASPLAYRPARGRGAAPAALLVAVDRAGRRPAVDACDFDLMLTTAGEAARPWIVIEPAALDAEIAALATAVDRHGIAAAVLAQVLRAGEALSFDDALVVESFAFSMLLGGAQFQTWMRKRRAVVPAPVPVPVPVPAHASAPERSTRVRCTRDGDVLTIHLAHAARRNAFDAAMRDALVEALAAAGDDPTVAALELRGDGPDFSAGGDLQEFGAAADPALAHAIRTLRSPARLLGRLAARTTVHLHGACVGAGIEIPAAAGRVLAAPGTRLWLPELEMGLIPGAGGTATLARRIGRQRLLHWALRGTRLDAATALAWGLVDAIASPAGGCAAAERS
jgi:enoyl-CoA hydratase/carnithine racemase